MKRLLPSVVPVLAGGLLLAACSTTPISRVNANRALYESWPIEIREAVLDGRAERGMTPEMVRVAKGNPSRIEQRSGSKGQEEVWVYQTGSNMGGTQLSIGGGYGGMNVIGAPGSTGSGVTEVEEVVFVDGVVLISY
jgi:hypothetical protein